MDLNDARSFRGRSASRGIQAAGSETFPRVNVDFYLLSDSVCVSMPVEEKILSPAEEIRFVEYFMRCQ